MGINNTAKANFKVKEDTTTVLTTVKNVSQIEVHGNVQVYLTSGENENVKVYDNYYSNNALVQNENNLLRITSYSVKKLVVWVTVNNLEKLSVFDDSEVHSFGKFSALDLNVSLFNHGIAQLDMDVLNVSVNLNNLASADLKGTVENGMILYDRSAWLDTTGLTVASLTQIIKNRPMRRFHHVNPSLI